MLWRLLFALLAGQTGSVFPLLASPTGSLKGHITVKRHDGSDKKDYSEVVLFVTDVPPSPTSARAEIRQRGKEFVPRVLVVAPGTEVTFPNDDKVEHNVFSHSSISDFDLGRFGKGPGKSRKFDKPGVSEIFCNVHKEMVAYLVIAPSSLFAITGQDGSFEIKNVPAGKHKLQIWERFARPRVLDETIDIPAGGSATLDREIQEKVDTEPSHKNKFGVDYPTNYH
jgi:plastocyanin